MYAVLALLAAGLLFDEPVSRALTHWPESERAVFNWITRWGKSDWILLPTLVIAPLALLVARFAPLSYTNRWTVHAVGAMSGFIFLGVGAPGLASAIAKRILGRARPVLIEDFGPWYFQPVQFDWRLESFPSGHTTTAFAFATVLVMLFGPRLRWVFLAAAAIGLSRIVVGMHYLTDVALGVAFGVIGAILVQRVFLLFGWVFLLRNGRIRNRMLVPVRRWWRRLRAG
jgi:undecaprenyl-diphosphatase